MKPLIAIALLAGTSFAETPKEPPKKEVPKAYTSYPGSRQLCYQHISGNTMHIMWSTHATADDLAKVVAHYEKGLGIKPKAGDHGTKTFEVDADRRVVVYPVASVSKHPSCDTKPKAGEKTIVMISTAAR